MLFDTPLGERSLGDFPSFVAYPVPFQGSGSLAVSTIQIARQTVAWQGAGFIGALGTGGVAAPPEPRWQIGDPHMRYVWTVHVGLASLTWFRVTHGQCGVDPHLIIGIAVDLECLINRFKPAHTQVVFDYSTLESGGPMAGTP